MKRPPLRKAVPRRGFSKSRAQIAAELDRGLDALVLVVERGELEALALSPATSLVELAFLDNVATNLGRLYTMIGRRRRESGSGST